MQLHLRFFINYYLEYLSTFWNLCTIIGLSLKNGHVFFKERKSPDIPENISNHKRNTETTDSAFLDQEQPKKRAKTKKDTRTSYQKYLHWQKSRPNTCTSTRNVFSKLYYTSNKVLDISIVIWKGKAIVIFQNCHTDLG